MCIGASCFSIPPFGLSADGNVVTNGVTRGVDWANFPANVIAHEMSHTMGLPDTYEIGAASPALHANRCQTGRLGDKGSDGTMSGNSLQSSASEPGVD